MTLSRPCLWPVFGAVLLVCGLESLAQTHQAFDWRAICAGGRCGMKQDFKREHIYDFYNTLDSIGVYVRITRITRSLPNYDVDGASLVYTDMGPPAHDYYAVQLPEAKGHRIKVTERLAYKRTRSPGFVEYVWPNIRVSDPLPLCINRAENPIHPLLKETEGLSIPLNINDSDGDDIPDMNDEYIPDGNSDLVKLQIRNPSGAPVDIKIDSNSGGDIIRLYERQTKKYGDSEGAIPARLGDNLKTHSPYKGFNDEFIYAEGIRPGTTFLTVTGSGGIEDRIKINVTSANKAFAGRRMLGWGNAHINGIASSMEALLYEVAKDQSLSKADAISMAPTRRIWYTFSHGLVDGSGDFKAVDYAYPFSDPFFPTDVPSGVDYLLVFLNGCCSAQIGSGSNADAFKTAFNANTYIGWKTEINGGLAAGFAEEFFNQLNGGKTISQAINAAIGTYAPGSYAYTELVSNIRVIGDGNLVLDLSP